MSKETYEKNKARIVYEDDAVFAFVPEKPMSKGHIKVYPKNDHNNMEDMSDDMVEHIFYTASYSATTLFEVLKAQGTNILALSGDLGDDEPFHIDIISREADDGINFMWQPKQLQPKEMDDVENTLKSEAHAVEVKEGGKDGPPQKEEDKWTKGMGVIGQGDLGTPKVAADLRKVKIPKIEKGFVLEKLKRRP